MTNKYDSLAVSAAVAALLANVDRDTAADLVGALIRIVRDDERERVAVEIEDACSCGMRIPANLVAPLVQFIRTRE